MTARTVGSLLDRIVKRVMGRVRFFGIYEYVVQSQGGEFVELKPLEKKLRLPDSIRTPTRPGVPGAKATLAIGASVLVQFVNGSENRPVIVGFIGADGTGFVPTRLTLDASDTVIVAPSGKADLSATAGGTAYVIRNGEKFGIGPTPALANFSAFATAAAAGTLLLTLPTDQLLAQGAPATGHSGARA